jgi:hypothetical protein
MAEKNKVARPSLQRGNRAYPRKGRVVHAPLSTTGQAYRQICHDPALPHPALLRIAELLAELPDEPDDLIDAA